MKSPATAGQQILEGFDLENVFEYKSQHSKLQMPSEKKTKQK